MRVTFDNGTAKYCCDWCKRDYGKEPGDHISLVIGERSGIASLDGSALPGWRLRRSILPGRRHFCNGQCLGSWATAAMGEEKKPAAEYWR